MLRSLWNLRSGFGAALPNRHRWDCPPFPRTGGFPVRLADERASLLPPGTLLTQRLGPWYCIAGGKASESQQKAGLGAWQEGGIQVRFGSGWNFTAPRCMKFQGFHWRWDRRSRDAREEGEADNFSVWQHRCLFAQWPEKCQIKWARTEKSWWGADGVQGFLLLGSWQRHCSRCHDRPWGLVHASSEGQLGKGLSFPSSLCPWHKSVVKSSPQAVVGARRMVTVTPAAPGVCLCPSWSPRAVVGPSGSITSPRRACVVGKGKVFLLYHNRSALGRWTVALGRVFNPVFQQDPQTETALISLPPS